MILIAQAYSYCISITKSKVFSIIIAIINSETSSNTVVRLYIGCKSLCTGTYFIAFIADILWILLLVILRFLVMQFLILILMEFLLVLVAIILRLLMMVVLIALKTVLLNFRSGVKVCVRGPPYTTAPPCNAWGNAPRR